MYAHSIKNPHIIHFRMVRRKEDLWISKYRYLCCGSYTQSKGTPEPKKVTCQNCLRIMKELKGDRPCSSCRRVCDPHAPWCEECFKEDDRPMWLPDPVVT